MIHYAPCKINIGLQILSRRSDGYHNLSTIMYPVFGLYDIVEVIKTEDKSVHFSSSGLPLDCESEDNLCVRAHRLLQSHYGIGGAAIHLHKSIPFGAGLGGGSSDAVSVLKLLNRIYHLNLSPQSLIKEASYLGSDTAFFVYDIPMLCSGRGEEMHPISVSLENTWLTIIKPPYGIKTSEAYRHVVPDASRISLEKCIEKGVDFWKNCLSNDFESSVMKAHPELYELKEKLYESGAFFVSMTGSGSAFYALSHKKLILSNVPSEYFRFSCLLNK